MAPHCISISRRSQVAGRPTDIPDTEGHHELYNESGPTQDDEYDSSAPNLALPELLRRIETLNRIRAERNATKPYVHNPFYLNHIFGNAPYTVHLCKRCTHRRKCPRHRHVFQRQTSISLCPAGHVRMNLYWAVDDPVNAKSSWHFEVKEYFGRLGGADSHRVQDAKDRERAAHEECHVWEMSERWGELAVRVVEDMRREKRGRIRGNVARAKKEIAVMAGAWERGIRGRVSVAERRKRSERKVARRREMARMAEEAARASPAREVVAATEIHVVQTVGLEDDITEPGAIEVTSSEEDMEQPTSLLSHSPQHIPADATPSKSSTLTTHPTPPRSTINSPAPNTAPNTASLTPEPSVLPEEPPSLPSPTQSTAPSTQSTIPNTPSPPLASPTQKRKRSSTFTTPPRLSISPTKKVKKVSWAPELVDVERPRMASPQLAGDDSYSPVDDEAIGEDKIIAREEDDVTMNEADVDDQEQIDVGYESEDVSESGDEEAKEEALGELFVSNDETSNDKEEVEGEADNEPADFYVLDDLFSGTENMDEEHRRVKFAMPDAVEDSVNWADISE